MAQVVAAGLGLTDLSLIKVRSANTFVGNNNIWTGGSQGSDHCCYVSLFQHWLLHWCASLDLHSRSGLRPGSLQSTCC